MGDFALLSDEIGRTEYIVGAAGDLPKEPIEALHAKVLTGDQIGSLFGALCIASNFDRAAYDAARSQRAPEFRTAHFVLQGTPKLAAVEVAQERSDYGRSSLWLGEHAGELKGRQALTYSGQIVILHPFDPEDSYAPQCNLTLRVAGLATSASVLDAIQNAATGFTRGKRIEKPKYGYATWTRPVENGRIARIKASASDLNKPEQTVHMTLQLLPVGKTK